MDGTTMAPCDAHGASSHEEFPSPVEHPSSNQAAAPRAVYFTFKDFLSEKEQSTFFDWPHARQIAKVTSYLEFVAKQPAAANFTSSSRASTSWAEPCVSNGSVFPPQTNERITKELLEGRTKSGFGAFGSEDGFLPQKELSLAVAHSVEEIGHEYIVERNKKGEVRPPVLNSRSFYLNWCHAEKQKLMDIKLKLDQQVGNDAQYHASRSSYWETIVVVVDRAMCLDCIQYARSLAAHEKAHVIIQDPSTRRVFPPSKAQEVIETDTSTLS